MALRIKNKWHRAYPEQVLEKTLAEHASALGFIGWRLALETAKKLHGDGFDYESDRERVGVITEFVAFVVHVSDRMAHVRLADQDREVFIHALAGWYADFMNDNLVDISGPGDYRTPFVALLNRRLGDYAELGFGDDGPGYDLYRYLGACVLEVMGETQINRWVIDQVVEIEGPEVWEPVRKSFENLFAVEDAGDGG